ncbi:MAG: prepilin-type N-terminal cleavage/methylation domain-containing protein [Actinobacteria bacterium]|nr:MAG: prepilin-type N-terminal cleavage/methylation domain-containing protein [Actinomycetota bacterium]
MNTQSTLRLAGRTGTPRHRAQGFTATEMVVALAIAAILATLAVPAFNGIIASQRAQVCASDLYVALAKARSNAVARNNTVTLQAIAGNWQNGWQILDVNNNVLDSHAAETAVTIAPQAAVTYTASGRLPAGTAAPVFAISTTSGSTHNYQCVSVTLTGRPYMKAAQTC